MSFKSTPLGFVSEMNGSPTLSIDQLTQIRVGNLYVKPKLLTTAHHDLGGCTFHNTHEYM